MVERARSRPSTAWCGWRRKDLGAPWLFEEFRISIETTVANCAPWALPSSRLGRATTPRTSAAMEAFKKTSRPDWTRSGGPAGRHRRRALVARRGQDRAEEQDHPALGRTRHPALSPARPTNSWAYIFGAICPAKGKGAGLVLPCCDTEAMAAHLEEISPAVAPGAHAVRAARPGRLARLGQAAGAGQHHAPAAAASRSPELNPVENVWQFVRDNWLSNRVFASYDDIVDHCCDAWNKLVDQPWSIMSLGLRDWAHGF